MKGIPGCFSLFVLIFTANKSILHLSCLQKYFSGKSNVSNYYSSYCWIIPSSTVTINGRSIWLKHCSQINFTVCIPGFLHVYAQRLIKIGYLCNWFKESEMLVLDLKEKHLLKRELSCVLTFELSSVCYVSDGMCMSNHGILLRSDKNSNKRFHLLGRKFIQIL